MKTITLLAAVLLATAAHATEAVNFSGTENRFSFDEPIAFNERGIEFYVFPNGEFDFNTETSAGADVYYRNGRRSTINSTYGAPGHSNGGVRIEHDSQGRVRRIGNVFLNYDGANRIKRIGSVYMGYDRERLTQVGGMRLVYNNRGQLVNIHGNVNGNTAYAYNDNSYFYGPTQGNNYIHNNDDDYYYYKTDGTKAKSGSDHRK
jgi:hypothetical protein